MEYKERGLIVSLSIFNQTILENFLISRNLIERDPLTPSTL